MFNVCYMLRICAGELYAYERDDLPLVTMFASTNSKSVGEVQAEIDQDIQYNYHISITVLLYPYLMHTVHEPFLLYVHAKLL